MSPALTNVMVEGMDDMGGLLLKPTWPAFASSGIKHDRAPKIVRIKGLVTVRPHGISIVGAAQGQRDADRRDAIKRGGV